MKILRIALISTIASSAVFSLCGLIFSFGDWNKLEVYAIIGATIGLLAAPEFAPKDFTHPVIWQSFWGGVCAFLIAIFLEASVQNAQTAALVGAIIGMTAKLWLKHLPLP